MASSKVMESSNTRNSNLSRRASSSSSTTTTTNPQQQQQEQILSDVSNFASAMTVDNILRDIYNITTVSTTDATLLDAQITLIDTNEHHRHPHPRENENGDVSGAAIKSVDDVWREIVSGEKKEMKEEAVDEMMTLEDFLAKAGAAEGEEAAADVDVKATSSISERVSGGVYSFDLGQASPFQVEGSIFGFGNGVEVAGGRVRGRRKRGRAMLEPLDKAAQQRQRRMIKNRESAARSRERKQAYQVELESLAVRLEEENERLLKERAESTKERFKQLMEKVVPVVEKRKPPRVLRRVHSMQW